MSVHDYVYVLHVTLAYTGSEKKPLNFHFLVLHIDTQFGSLLKPQNSTTEIGEIPAETGVCS